MLWIYLQPVFAAFAIICFYWFIIICAMPISFLTVPLGYAFKEAFNNFYVAFFYGFFVILIGCMLGALTAFLISRYLLRTTFKKTCAHRHKFVRAIDKVITDDGAKIIFFIRLTFFPYSLLSYLFGITKVKLSQFILGNLGMSFHLVVWIYIGAQLKDI
mmetsp:Transcript_8628/g.7953  ORF Transcript_8628/g.7953 Transcript_8628/m.7953 type:complete len:159 (-) Transcript_8628:329-805(-)